MWNITSYVRWHTYCLNMAELGMNLKTQQLAYATFGYVSDNERIHVLRWWWLEFDGRI